MKLINLLKQSLKEYDLKKPDNIYASGGEDSNDPKQSLKGKTINLIRTLGTKEENLTGEIGVIDNYEDMDDRKDDVSGFWLMNPSNGKKMGYVMWDEKRKKFIEGDSTWDYNYKGKSSADQAMLDKFKK
jgi:hypothetical protein